MITHKRQQQWDHTSALMALIVNAVQGKGRGPVTPVKLNPYRNEVQEPHRRLSMSRLKAIADGNGWSDTSR